VVQCVKSESQLEALDGILLICGHFAIYLFGLSHAWLKNIDWNLGTPATDLSVLIATDFTLVSCLASSSALKTEAKCYFETPFQFQRTTFCYIQKIEFFITLAA
jgi:hypothetical protein